MAHTKLIFRDQEILAGVTALADAFVDRMRVGTGAFGFNAARGEYVDLVLAGIIDPTKVVRSALENAVRAWSGLSRALVDGQEQAS